MPSHLLSQGHVIIIINTNSPIAIYFCAKTGLIDCQHTRAINIARGSSMRLL